VLAILALAVTHQDDQIPDARADISAGIACLSFVLLFPAMIAA